MPGRGRGRRSRPSAPATSSAGRGWSRPTAGTSTPARSSAARAIDFDGACLRGKCEADPDARLRADEALRRRDDRAPAGDPAPAARRLRRTAAAAEAAADAGRWCRVPYRVVRPRARRPPTPGRSSSSPRTATAARRFAPGQFNMLYAFGAGEVPISISGAPEPRPARPHDPRRRRGHAARSAPPSPATRSACAGPFGSCLAVAGGRGRRRRDRRRRHRPGAAALRRARRCSPRRERYGAVVAPLRRPRARAAALPRASSGAGATARIWRSA